MRADPEMEYLAEIHFNQPVQMWVRKRLVNLSHCTHFSNLFIYFCSFDSTAGSITLGVLSDKSAGEGQRCHCSSTSDCNVRGIAQAVIFCY